MHLVCSSYLPVSKSRSQPRLLGLYVSTLHSKALLSPNLRTTKPMCISGQQRAAGGTWVQKVAQAQAAASIVKKLSHVTPLGSYAEVA